MTDLSVAQNVTVDGRGILIDGLRLPYYLAPNEVEVIVKEAPYFTEITYTLLAESVSITEDVVASPRGSVILIEPETS
jgi:hypothetical protein